MRALGLLVWLLGALALGSAASGATILGAGHAGQGWVAIESTWQDKPAWTLYHFPDTAPPGTAIRVRGMPSMPEAMGASGMRVVLVYPGERQGERIGMRGVRAISAVSYFEGERYRYEPPNRGEVLPPLPGWGRIEGFLVTPDAPAALLREDDGQRRSALLVLDRSEWSETPLPPELSPAGAWALAPVETAHGRFGVVEHQPGRALLWTRAPGEAPGPWTSEVIPLREAGALLRSPGGGLLSVSRAPGGRVELRMLRQDRAYTLGGAEGVPAEHAAFAVGDNTVIAWIDPDSQTRMRVTVLTSIRGETLFNGFARMQAILTARDMQYLALLMAAVVLMIVIFVLRPEPATTTELTIPQGVAPSPPGRRALAAALDVAPIAFVVSRAWDVDFIETIGFSMDMGGAGIWPLLTTIGVAFVYQTLTEWAFAATPGKMAFSCRTISLGERSRLRFRQAAVRNLVKYACPPLTMLVLADPTRRHPGDYFAGSLVVSPMTETPPEGGPDKRG